MGGVVVSKKRRWVGLDVPEPTEVQIEQMLREMALKSEANRKVTFRRAVGARVKSILGEFNGWFLKAVVGRMDGGRDVVLARNNREVVVDFDTREVLRRYEDGREVK